MTIRAVRGATQVERDERELILAATAELVAEVLVRNELEPADV
ncbi:MAG: chorismate mutase, partial [Mycobacteriales bacterium]